MGPQKFSKLTFEQRHEILTRISKVRLLSVICSALSTFRLICYFQSIFFSWFILVWIPAESLYTESLRPSGPAPRHCQSCDDEEVATQHMASSEGKRQEATAATLWLCQPERRSARSSSCHGYSIPLLTLGCFQSGLSLWVGVFFASLFIDTCYFFFSKSYLNVALFLSWPKFVQKEMAKELLGIITSALFLFIPTGLRKIKIRRIVLLSGLNLQQINGKLASSQPPFYVSAANVSRHW